jgi:hypothetical protein
MQGPWLVLKIAPASDERRVTSPARMWLVDPRSQTFLPRAASETTKRYLTGSGTVCHELRPIGERTRWFLLRT